MRALINARILVVAGLLAWSVAAWADWPTNRGNPQRTGNLDDKPGPKAPRVAWVYKAQEHFVASPVLGANKLYVSGLGAFNTGIFHCLSLETDAPQRVLWSKAAPFIKLPIVCAPAAVEDLLVFGDGMHQTDGAILYCIQAETGLPLWQYPVPGKLVHLEGAPTIDRDMVYIGGGEAGVLCVSLKQVALDGKDQDLAAVRAVQKKKWDEMVAKYEQDKKKDPQFAVPPSEDALPKPVPKLVWREGQGKWHVDAPVTVWKDKLLVASAYIEEDKVGKRSLLCLNARDGKVVWEAPLTVNPWAGATVAGDTVLVGCSSIRFDRKLIEGAKGAIEALNLADGQAKWRRDVAGGILSPVAAKGDVVIYAGTDGKVVARNIASGERKWTYECPNPFFAGPAIAGGAVYVADLKGVLHALNLEDGKVLWALDIPADASVQARGMVFGSPIVHAGKVYLATCNLDGESDQPCAVVCVADESGLPPPKPVPIVIDKQKRTITIPCKIAPRKLPTLSEVYPLEVVATFPAPRGQKAHETVVTFNSLPSEVHKALEGFGLKPGSPARGEGEGASGPEVKIYLALPGFNNKPRLVPIERTMVDGRTGKPLPPLKWRFTGSSLRQPDPSKEAKVYGADLGGTLITLFPVTDETVFQNDLTMKECKLLKMETNKNLLPEEGAPVDMVIEAK